MIIYFQSIFLNVLGILPSIFSNHISEIHAFKPNKNQKQEFDMVAETTYYIFGLLQKQEVLLYSSTLQKIPPLPIFLHSIMGQNDQKTGGRICC